MTYQNSKKIQGFIPVEKVDELEQKISECQNGIMLAIGRYGDCRYISLIQQGTLDSKHAWGYPRTPDNITSLDHAHVSKEPLNIKSIGQYMIVENLSEVIGQIPVANVLMDLLQGKPLPRSELPLANSELVMDARLGLDLSEVIDQVQE